MRVSFSVFALVVALSRYAEAAPLPLFLTDASLFDGDSCSGRRCYRYEEPNGVSVIGEFWWLYPGLLGIYSYDEPDIWVEVPRGFRVKVEFSVSYQTPDDYLPVGYEVTGNVDGGGGFFTEDRTFTGSRFFGVTVYGDNSQASAYISGTVPEPGLIAMLGVGLAGVVRFTRQRYRV